MVLGIFKKPWGGGTEAEFWGEVAHWGATNPGKKKRVSKVGGGGGNGGDLKVGKKKIQPNKKGETKKIENRGGWGI